MIELLVVLTIIALLAGLILPAVGRSLNAGKAAGCTSNAHQIGLALISFDGDYGYLPWLNEGYYKGQQDNTGVTTNSQLIATNWYTKLYYFKYLPSSFDKGVWRCPGAAYSEITGKDTSGNPANYGGYGVSWNIFRNENSQDPKTFGNNPNSKLKMSRVLHPDSLWLVGDCGRAVSKSAPGSGRYQRTSSSFGYPGTKGNWDFSNAYTDPAPALRHNGEARYAAFDAHVLPLDWTNMKGETNDFVGRYGGF